MYQLIMKMDDDCDDRRVEFEIYTYTLASEKPTEEQWYFHQNGDGTYDKDSAKTLQECWLDEEDEYYQICYWKIGYFEDYIDLGLANPWQTVAAFMGDYGWEGVYDWQIYYYSSADSEE